jgi:hypothetical protein
MQSLRPRLFDAGGGLRYHGRAWRHRLLWLAYCRQLAAWLAAWQPPERQLVIIGPSAGHTLGATFLARFDRIVVLEPDPLARWLLRRRFPACRFQADHLDCFASQDGPVWLARLYPEAAFLFANVIGQYLPGAGWATTLVAAMQSRSWASCHDLLASPRTPAQRAAQTVSAGMVLESLLEKFWSGGELPVHDHATWGLLPLQQAAIWSITPSQHHLVGWHAQISAARDAAGGNAQECAAESASARPKTGIGGRS